MYLQCSHGFWGQYFSGWCFTHQYKNTTQFYFYAPLLPSQNTNQNPTVYSKQIWSSELIYNAWMKIIKIGRICIAWGSFVVKEEKNITNVDLFNISNTGITPMDYTTFSLSSFNPTDQGGIGALNLDGKVVFALPESGTKEWRFNFSFVSS